ARAPPSTVSRGKRGGDGGRERQLCRSERRSAAQECARMAQRGRARRRGGRGRRNECSATASAARSWLYLHYGCRAAHAPAGRGRSCINGGESRQGANRPYPSSLG